MRRKITSTVEYLAFLSAKYEVDPDRLFLALIMARESKKSSCGDLSIEWRGETQDRVMFLILTNSKVVAQVSIFKEFLAETDPSIRYFMETGMARRFLVKKAKQSTVLTIRDLRSGMTQICLNAKVLEIAKPNLVYTSYGNHATVANALIEDKTGTIRMTLWNEQISSISAGDTIKIDNARVVMYKGQRQLNIGRKGLLSSVDKSTCQAKPVIC